jgi:hypothetical protein
MDGGASRSDIAVVVARNFLSAEIEGMSMLDSPKDACRRVRRWIEAKEQGSHQVRKRSRARLYSSRREIDQKIMNRKTNESYWNKGESWR